MTLQRRIPFLLSSLLFVATSVEAQNKKADPGPGPMQIVTAEIARIKVNRGGKTLVVGTANKGTRLWPTQTQGGFLLVVAADTGKRGWIASSLTVDVQYSDDQRKSLTVASQLIRDASQAREKNDLLKAENLLRKTLKTREQILGADHPETADSLHQLAELKTSQRDYAAAEPLYQRALASREHWLGRSSALWQSTVRDAAFSLVRAGKDDRAIDMLEAAIVNGNQFRDDALQMDMIQFALGKISTDIEGNFRCLRNGEVYSRTIDILVRLRTAFAAETDPASRAALRMNANIGAMLHQKGDNEAAEELLSENLNIIRNLPEEQQIKLDTTYSSVLNNLASVYAHTSRRDKSAELFREGVDVLERAGPSVDAERFAILANLSRILVDMGAGYEAEELMLEALAGLKKTYGQNHKFTAIQMMHLGNLYAKLKEFAQARATLTQAVETLDQHFGRQHGESIAAVVSLGRVTLDLGNLTEAKRIFADALQRTLAAAGPEHPTALDIQIRQQQCLIAAGDDSSLKPTATRILKTLEKQYGPDSSQYTYAVAALSALYLRAGDVQSAIPLLKQELDLRREQVSAANDSRTKDWLISPLNNYSLAIVSIDPVAARTAMDEALAIPSTIEDQTLALIQMNDGLIDVANKGFRSGYRKIQRARELARQHSSKTLPNLPTDAINSHLQVSYLPDLNRCLSLAYYRPDDRQLARLSASWLLNGKSIGQESLAEAALVNTEESAPMVRELRDTRGQLATLASSVPEHPKYRKHHLERVAVLETRERELVAELSRIGLGLQKEETWMSIGRLRERIPFDSVFINIARVRINRFAETGNKYSWDDDRYLAWVIPSVDSENSIRVVDLGLADTMDDAIAEVRKAIVTSAKRVSTDGESSALTSLNASLAELSRMILGPLQPHIEGNKSLIIGPDGDLWTVPWEMLQSADEKFLIEDYQVRYVLSGRELIRDLPGRASVAAPAIFADPDFDRQLSSGTANAGKNVNSKNLADTRSADDPSLRKFARLKGSAQEAAAIRDTMEAFAGSATELSVGADASESRFKQLARPRVLVVSTHGFFMPDADTSEHSIPLNPLLRCGLALAGCNTSLGIDSNEDGILWGLEVVGCDLRGTEMVVLSACETGLGDVHSGEGVAGLRQAFQLAGAESVVSTLWQIPDQETAKLMDAMFANLAGGMNKTEALRHAQLSRISARRERFGAAHPFFWAAFTLTGQE